MMLKKFSSVLFLGFLFQIHGALAVESSSDSQCKIFFAKEEKIEGGLSKKEEFSSGPLALQELKLGSEYPAYPKEREELLRAILASKDSDSKNEDALESQISSTGIDSCNSAEYFAWLTRLIHSADAFKFNQEQRHELNSLLLSHLRSDAVAPRPLVQQELNLKLIEFAKDKAVLKISSEKMKKLKAAISQIELPLQKEADRESKVEKRESQVVDPPTSSMEKQREERLIHLTRRQLQESEKLRVLIREVLDLSDEGTKS